MAVPAPGMLSTTEKGWLQHTPKYIFENHTQPLSGILLIYVSLVYSITSLIGHVKVKNESNNIAKAIDNAIQSFCRHRVDYRCFRESYDMFRSRYRAFLAGLRGNELDCATTMKEYHMIAFNTGLAADATLEDLAMYHSSTAPPDWFEKMAAILRGMPSKQERDKKLGDAFKKDSPKSRTTLRWEIKQLVNIHEQMPNFPDSIVDDFAVVQSLAPSSPFFQELGNDVDFRMRTRPRYMKSLDPNAKPHLDTGRIPKPKNDQSVAAQQTVSAGDSTTPQGYGKVVRGSKTAAQQDHVERPTKGLKISSSSSATRQEDVFQGAYHGSVYKGMGSDVSSKSVYRPLLPKPQVSQYPASLHTSNAAQAPLVFFPPSSVGAVSSFEWPTPTPLAAPPPLQVSHAILAPAQSQRGGDVSFSVPTNGAPLPASTAVSSKEQDGRAAPSPTASTSNTRGDMLRGSEEERLAILRLNCMSQQLRGTNTPAKLTSYNKLVLLFDPDTFKGLGESCTSVLSFHEFCETTTVFDEHGARAIDKFVGELLDEFVVSSSRRSGTFITFLQTGLDGMTAELAARAAKEAAQ